MVSPTVSYFLSLFTEMLLLKVCPFVGLLDNLMPCRARASNSGCIVHQSLPSSELLMRGHAAHDEVFSRICEDKSHTVAVLWPGEGAISLHELHHLAEQNTEGRVTLVAVDATWNGARALMGSYSTTLQRVYLQTGEIFVPGQKQSIMAPLRKYSPMSAKFDNRCALATGHPAMAAPLLLCFVFMLVS
jgi:hypothetical protein